MPMKDKADDKDTTVKPLLPCLPQIYNKQQKLGGRHLY